VEPVLAAERVPSAVPSVRVLVVDDFEGWRRFVRTALRKQREIEIVSEASDGPEAVLKATELHPDLILLDIGLPTLDGIETARQIRKISPTSRILFVSQESCADVVERALGTGAGGYVIKSHAAKELLPAIRSVLEGKPFYRE